jgi:homopolymeric O-antigen transport system permease protein
MNMIRNTVQNWSLIKDFVYRDFKARFAGSILGAAWNIMHPLVLIAIYIIIFSKIMRAKLPGIPSRYGYSVYLCTAIIPWGMFIDLLVRYTNLIFEHSNLIKKVSFPKEILHVSAMITGTINFFISFSIFIVFLTFLHFTGKLTTEIPFLRFLLFFAVLSLQQIFCLGLGMAFSVLNVFFRDIGQLVNISTLLWFWFTPIVYPISVVPDALKKFYVFNPMYHFIEIYRSIMYKNTMPALKSLVIITVVSLVTFSIGYFIYSKLINDVADEI